MHFLLLHAISYANQTKKHMNFSELEIISELTWFQL